MSYWTNRRKIEKKLGTHIQNIEKLQSERDKKIDKLECDHVENVSQPSSPSSQTHSLPSPLSDTESNHDDAIINKPCTISD